MIVLKDAFNIFRRDMNVGFVDKVWDAYDFKVGLRLKESGGGNAIIVCSKGHFDIFFNFLEIGICSHIVC